MRAGASAPTHAQVAAAGEVDEKHNQKDSEEEKQNEKGKAPPDWAKGPGRWPRVNLGAIGTQRFADLMDTVMEFCYEADERAAETDKKGAVKIGAPIARVR